MESILSMQDEVYPFRCRRRKSSAYLNNMTTIRNTTAEKTNRSSDLYHSLKTMISQRFVYILGILNLVLAAIAIVCVAQAEDHPEYFSLVYIAVGVFLFYMGTIVFIIVLQIVETYQQQQQTKAELASSMEIPLLTPRINVHSNPVLVQKPSRKPDVHTRLLRSQTLPLTLTSSTSDRQQQPSPVTTSSTPKDFDHATSMRSELLSKTQPSLPTTYHSFSSTNHEQPYPSFTTLTHSDSSSHSPSLIRPIPLHYRASNDSSRSKVKFLEY